MAMAGFLIEYKRSTGDARIVEFPGPKGHEESLRRRLELEEQRTDPDVEIVSLIADSLDTIKRTHSRYFFRNVTIAG